jgi:type VI protein secretion system component VasF
MGQSKHTPGPWVVAGNPGAETLVRAGDKDSGRRIADTFCSQQNQKSREAYIAALKTNEANARLIAATPAMLDALHDLALAMAAILERPDDASLRPHAVHFLERARAALVSATPSDTHEVG